MPRAGATSTLPWWVPLRLAMAEQPGPGPVNLIPPRSACRGAGAVHARDTGRNRVVNDLGTLAGQVVVPVRRADSILLFSPAYPSRVTTDAPGVRHTSGSTKLGSA